MDIEQLISSIDKLKTKSNDLNQKMVAKISTLDKINSEIDKEKQRLEAEVKKLAKSVEAKLKESEEVDRELSFRSSLLSRMQQSRNSLTEELVRGDKEELDNNVLEAGFQADESELKPIVVNTKNLKENSLEDFLKIQFEREFKVQYPKITDRYLDKRDFGQVVEILKERMRQSKEPHKVIDEYIANYQQSVSDEQVKQLEGLKMQKNL